MQLTDKDKLYFYEEFIKVMYINSTISSDSGAIRKLINNAARLAIAIDKNDTKKIEERLVDLASLSSN